MPHIITPIPNPLPVQDTTRTVNAKGEELVSGAELTRISAILTQILIELRRHSLILSQMTGNYIEDDEVNPELPFL